MLRIRSIIETIIDLFQNISQIEHSRHRSPVNCKPQHRLRFNRLLPPTSQACDRHRSQFAFCRLILTRTPKKTQFSFALPVGALSLETQVNIGGIEEDMSVPYQNWLKVGKETLIVFDETVEQAKNRQNTDAPVPLYTRGYRLLNMFNF